MTVDKIDNCVELWLSVPSPFVARHQRDILPSWQVDVASILVVLQRSPLPLTHPSWEVEVQKDRLRSQFLTLATSLTAHLQNRGFAADAIDPKSGTPIISHPGRIHHDDVAATVASLGFAVQPGDCTALVHPNWSTAVYPGILLSSASWGDFATVVREWGQSGSVF